MYHTEISNSCLAITVAFDFPEFLWRRGMNWLRSSLLLFRFFTGSLSQLGFRRRVKKYSSIPFAPLNVQSHTYRLYFVCCRTLKVLGRRILSRDVSRIVLENLNCSLALSFLENTDEVFKILCKVFIFFIFWQTLFLPKKLQPIYTFLYCLR